MCHNKEVSIITYVITIIASIVLFYKGVNSDKYIAIFSIVFVHVQLVEFLLWYSLETDNKELNHYSSIALNFDLYLNVLSVYVLSLIYDTTIFSKNIIKLLMSIVIVVGIVSLVLFIMKII